MRAALLPRSITAFSTRFTPFPFLFRLFGLISCQLQQSLWGDHHEGLLICQSFYRSSYSKALVKCTAQTLKESANNIAYVILSKCVDRTFSGRSVLEKHFQLWSSSLCQTSTHQYWFYKFDRFKRSREDNTFDQALLKNHGVSVINASELIEDSLAGLLIEVILETITEFYSKNLVQGTTKSKLSLKKRGKTNQKLLFDYRQ